jgi:TolB-like protein/Tfp pilus assembly protein PilF
MSSEGVQQPGLEDEDLLEGWKAIADHLNKTERTVQRWEKAKALPVRRLKSASSEDQGRVFAYKKELDAWWQEMLTRPDEPADLTPDPDHPPSYLPQPAPLPPDALPPRPRRSISFWVAITLAVILGALTFLLIPNPTKNPLQPSRGRVTLAVRQFRNLNDTSSQDFVAAGLTEEMVTHLGQLHPQQMSVIRLTPGYATASLERLAKDIGADYVLEGSIRQIANQMTISAQLVQVNSQTVVWGHSYERDVKELLRVQEEVASAITGEVLNKLPHSAAAVREVNREAYLAYLEGRYFWNKRTAESLTRALDLFQQSVAIDPTYAPSYAGLADCYELLGSAPYTALPPNQAFPKAEAAAKKALELDSTLAEAHVSLGYSKLVYEWNLPEAEKELARALQLRPDYATGHQFYAYYLTAIGNLGAAIAERKRALELDPVNPLLTSALGEAFYQNREFDRTVEQNSKSLQLDPSYAIALVNIGRAYEMKGMHPQAREAFEKILAVAPNDPAVLALIGHEYAVSGEKAKAAGTISKLQQLSTHTYVPAIYVALVYTGLHDLDHAFVWLDKACNERSEYLVYLPTEPLADPLRGDPRFSQLLQRVGLTNIPAPTALRSAGSVATEGPKN